SFIWKRRPDRSRRATLVPVIEMVDVVVVEIDGLLDQAHAQQAETEVQIGLRVAHGGSDVVETENRMTHHPILHAVSEAERAAAGGLVVSTRTNRDDPAMPRANAADQWRRYADRKRRGSSSSRPG